MTVFPTDGDRHHHVGLAATRSLLNESGSSSRESCRRSLFQVYRRQNRGQIAHSGPSDRDRAGDAHQFCLMQRKAILISGRSGIVILCGRFQKGGSNGLEGSKDCRSVGGHGNQHVRLRSAQVSLSGVTGPVQEAIFAFEMRQAPEGSNMQAERVSDFSKKFSTGSFMPSDGDRSGRADRATCRRCDAFL